MSTHVIDRLKDKEIFFNERINELSFYLKHLRAMFVDLESGAVKLPYDINEQIKFTFDTLTLSRDLLARYKSYRKDIEKGKVKINEIQDK